MLILAASEGSGPSAATNYRRMNMELDYVIIGVVIVLALVFILWLVCRNYKDKKEFEQETSQSELKPEKHDDEQV